MTELSPITIFILAIAILAWRDWYFSNKYQNSLGSSAPLKDKVLLLKKSRLRNQTEEIIACLCLSILVHFIIYPLLKK